MCTDDKKCAANEDGGEGNLAKALAMLHGPGMERAMDSFLEHIRAIIPDFAKDFDHSTLLVIFSAGRNETLKYMLNHTETLYEAGNAMTAMVLTRYAEERDLDIVAMNESIDRMVERQQEVTT